MVDLLALQEPFAPGELSWRLMRAGKNDRGVWAICVPYVDSRVIMKRLDDVCGPGGWQSEARTTEAHVAVGIGILVGDMWVWRWDGSGRIEPNPKLSAADAGKGDFSNAFKRAAVQFGISRYLHDVPELFATVSQSDGRFRGTYKADGGKKVSFTWDPPALPRSALPTTEPPIVTDMRELLKQAGALGLGAGDDEKTTNAIAAIERGIDAHDRGSLKRARPWIEKEIERLTPTEGAA